MKTFLFITKITIDGNLNLGFYNDYLTALRNATLYVDNADEIEVEIQSRKEDCNWYVFEDFVRIKTEKQLHIYEESAK